MSHRKRKYRQRSNTHNSQYDNPDSPSSPRVDPTLFIVAHEADIIRGPQAARAADSLEVGINVDGKGGSRIGDALIKWEGNGIGEESESGNMWVDRYDARLLLDALPTVTTDPTTSAGSGPPHRPSSPDGWSDLPSDAEDTFFLTPAETADLHRTKRLRHLDDLRTARLRALSRDDADADAEPETDPWGGSDEEPDAAQMELMRRTAAHVTRATNDAQLRARILAHHGADPRFAFLRGRWGRAWARAQADARREVFAERDAQNAGALGGLTGYGSGGESEDGDGGADADGGSATEHAPTPMGGAPDVQDQAVREAEPEILAVRAAQEVRRAKAREWVEKWRAAKAPATADSDKDDLI